MTDEEGKGKKAWMERERSIFLLYTVYAVSTGFYMSWYSKCVCKCVCVESNLCKQQLWRSCSEGTFLFEICCQLLLRTHTDTHAHTGVSCFWLSRSTKAANVEFIPFLFECQWLKSFSVMNRSVLLFYKKRVCVCVCARLLYMQWNTKTLNFFSLKLIHSPLLPSSHFLLLPGTQRKVIAPGCRAASPLFPVSMWGPPASPSPATTCVTSGVASAALRCPESRLLYRMPESLSRNRRRLWSPMKSRTVSCCLVLQWV